MAAVRAHPLARLIQVVAGAPRLLRGLAVWILVSGITLVWFATPLLAAKPTAPPPQAAQPTRPAPGFCKDLLTADEPVRLEKLFVRQPEPQGASVEVTYELVSIRPDGEVKVQDCLFVDADTDRQYDPGEVVTSFNGDALFTAGSAQITMTITAVPGQTVCDRARRIGRTADGRRIEDVSSIVCHVVRGGVDPPPPVVPESPTAALLPASAVATLAAVLSLGVPPRGRRRHPV